MIKRFLAVALVVGALGAGPILAQDKDNQVERKAKEAGGAIKEGAQDAGREIKKDTKDVVGKVDGVPSELKDYAERSQNAANIVEETMGIKENGVPESLMSKAHAVMVIPHMIKGALGIGGRYGKGLVSERTANGQWGAPAFVEVGGGSFGLQLGADATDLVLVFTNKDGMDGMLKGKLKLGADAGLVAGPVGRKAEVGTDVLLKSGIFAYSRSKGLFAGIALDGTVVTIDDSANAKVYGKNVDAQNILAGKTQINATVRPYVDALEKYSPVVKKSTQR